MSTRILDNKVLRYTTGLCTFLAGVLHIALIPLFFTLLPLDVIVFFIVSGQLKCSGSYQLSRNGVNFGIM